MDGNKEKETGELDDLREDSPMGMLRLFYSREMLPMAVLLWINSLVAIGLMIFSAVRFFQTEAVRGQIMYAVIFLTAMHLLALVKILACQLINRNSLRRRLQRLERMIEDLMRSR